MFKRKTKREQEKATVYNMIQLYCTQLHHGNTICKDCEEVVAYANGRIDKCPFIDTKTFCSACKVHCYNKEMRDKIKEIMRYSGPRMIFHKPFMALHHVYIIQKEKQR